MKRRPLTQRLFGLAQIAALLGALFTAAGLFGKFSWFLELFTHMKPQLAVCFLGYAALAFALRRPRQALLSLAFCLVNLLPVILLMLPARTPPKTGGTAFRILQANILTTNTNAPALLALVAREQPDVIVLQEPGARWLSQLTALTNDYPVYAALPREDNFGAAIFCRTNALDAQIFMLPGDPNLIPSTRAVIDFNGRHVTVIGTHPFAPYNAATWHGRNRHLQSLAVELRKINTPLVLTGDLNTTPWSAHYRAFLKASGLNDSARGRSLQFTWPTFFHPALRIALDHCHYSDGVQIINKRLGPNIGSDHLPLIIDVVF